MAGIPAVSSKEQPFLLDEFPKGPKAGGPLGNADLAWFRTSSLSIHYTATYTEVGRMGKEKAPKGPVISLDRLVAAFRKVAREGLKAHERWMKGGPPLPAPKGIGKGLGILKEGSFTLVSAGALSMEVELDYDGLVMWKGHLFQADMHLELDLVQTAGAAASAAPPAGPLPLGGEALDTGGYIVSLGSAYSLSILEKASGLTTTLSTGGPGIPPVKASLGLPDGAGLLVDIPKGGRIASLEAWKKGKRLGALFPRLFSKDLFLPGEKGRHGPKGHRLYDRAGRPC